MNKKAIVAIALGLGGLWLLMAKAQKAGETQKEGGFFLPDVLGFIKASATNFYDGITDMANVDFKSSMTSGRGNKFGSKLEEIGTRNGLPPYLLASIAFKESRFRDEVISGKVKSGAGAAGMFQLMPMHWKSVDPYNWERAADYAAKMLAGFYKQFGGSWVNAVAAYNGYPSVYKKWAKTRSVNISLLTNETQDYVAFICSNLGWDY
ncbi:MAG: hypothetical protein RL571_1873 [Pseudomonadota bacterium]|jgi:soluble lytic murein transglycosylase-like protein